MGNLIIIVAGGPSSGKSTLAKFILAEFLNMKVEKKRFIIDRVGKETFLLDTFNGNRPIISTVTTDEGDRITRNYSCRLYSFSDTLRNICIDLFGLEPDQIYGSLQDLTSETTILWENFPQEIKDLFKLSNKKNKLVRGKIKANEFLFVLENYIFRKIDPNCLSRATYNQISKDNYQLAVVDDPKFANDVTIGSEIGAKAIFLTRNQPKDPLLPFGEYSLILDNSKATLLQTQKMLKPILHKWFADKGIL